MKTVVYSPAANKQLDALPLPAQEQITDALHAYAISGRGDIKSLSGRVGYRLRVGAYRIIFSEDLTTVLAIYIGRRGTTTYGRN